MLVYAMGITQHSHGVDNVRAVSNLALLTGIAGREGSGLYLCGEKANSQGAIDLGILPQGNGLGARAMLAAAGDGKMDALYVVAEDPLSSYPDRDSVAKALEQVPFLVVQDLFLSPTAEQAGVWLFSEALPQGWLDEGQAALIMRGLSLAQASELPDALMASLLEDSRGFVLASG